MYCSLNLQEKVKLKDSSVTDSTILKCVSQKQLFTNSVLQLFFQILKRELTKNIMCFTCR